MDSLASLREEGNEYAKVEMRKREEAAEEEATAREQAEFGDIIPPVPMLLDIGDIGIFDARLVHFGSAYARRSGVHKGPRARVALSATFAAAGPRGRIQGFLYNRLADTHADCTIGSILRKEIS